MDIVSTSEVTVSVTLDNINGTSKNFDYAISELKNIGKIEVLKEMAIICITGKDIKNKPEILENIFRVLKNIDISTEIISQGVSPLSISFVINQEDADNAIRELHKELFENE